MAMRNAEAAPQPLAIEPHQVAAKPPSTPSSPSSRSKLQSGLRRPRRARSCVVQATKAATPQAPPPPSPRPPTFLSGSATGSKGAHSACADPVRLPSSPCRTASTPIHATPPSATTAPGTTRFQGNGIGFGIAASSRTRSITAETKPDEGASSSLRTENTIKVFRLPRGVHRHASFSASPIAACSSSRCGNRFFNKARALASRAFAVPSGIPMMRAAAPTSIS